MIFLLLVLNFGISIFNSVVTGASWVETKAAGGWARFMSWMGATMAACGFTWCYLAVLALLAGPGGLSRLPPRYRVEIALAQWSSPEIRSSAASSGVSPLP